MLQQALKQTSGAHAAVRAHRLCIGSRYLRLAIGYQFSCKVSDDLAMSIYNWELFCANMILTHYFTSTFSQSPAETSIFSREIHIVCCAPTGC
jgi:hypothetical protein